MGTRIFEWRLTLWRLVHLPQSFWRLYCMWRNRFRVGEIYLDGFHHPVVVTESCAISPSGSRLGPWDYELAGISLLDGSSPRSSSVMHSAPERVSYQLACLWLANVDRLNQTAEHLSALLESSPALNQVWGQVR